MTTSNCRHCGHNLSLTFVDLGTAPPSNSYVTAEQLAEPETYFPLRVLVCDECWLVQTQDFAERDVFFSADYAYFSSTSKSWLAHAQSYVETMAERFDLTTSSCFVEVASNDGYLLQYVQELKVPCYGIEPTHSTAVASREKGIETHEEFFGRDLAKRLRNAGKSADLIAANNVLAHVPDINDFLAGFSILLKDTGVVTFEFPHLMRLVSECQFDTIYHEHYSYLSLLAVDRIATANGLHVFDVEEIGTHGGSLRVYAQRADQQPYPLSDNVSMLLQRERDAGMATREYYAAFQTSVYDIRNGAMRYLMDAKDRGLSVAAYGAAAKGNTFMNFCGIRSDLIEYVCDMAPAKQGKYMPGSRLPIERPNKIEETKPDRILIFPWNIKNEVAAQLSYVGDWDAKFVIAIPQIEEFSP
ncbi:SAM-dependent methyltransferase [Sulfitobacter sp. SK012]|nr:SAM-dependent methyltransferase [Sulfitobacter sp. SK012]